jgi:hypothetical protein
MWALLPAALGLLAGGCGGRPAAPGLTTAPVTGRVVFASGQPMTGGEVEFQSVEEPRTARGVIQADGSFTLRTFAGNDTVAGAVPGPHRVTIMPRLGSHQAGTSIHLPDTVTVQPGQANHCTVTVPGKP